MKKQPLYVFMLLIVVLWTGMITTHAQQRRSPLKVLFVGYDPSKPMPQAKQRYPGGMSKEMFEKQYPMRMPAFSALLRKYFAEVKTMDCRDWKPVDADPYDVVIFDFNTTILENAEEKKDADGKTKYIAERYLPDNFSKPVVFIATTAARMGERLGLKLDWLCHCLNSDAHHLNTQHAIFKGPLERVMPTLVMKETPEGIYHYTSGDTIPKEIPMWRVNIPEAFNGETPIGLVSRGDRFTEGPDAEVISSGVCTKDVGAVALGRHGNFFLWGFGSSPAEMTEEAKKVFVNVVAYMKQFDGRMPITRKYNERMATTGMIKETVGRVSKEGYDEHVKMINEFNESNAKEKKRIEDKKSAGQALTLSEEESLKYLGFPQPAGSYEEYLKKNMAKYADRFGTNAAAYQQFMKNNMDYLYCDPNAFYDYSVDEDVQKIGVSNHSIKLLDACIDMMKRNDQPDLALRVLKRYTGENFTTAKEWSKWLTGNRKKLFFSETGGYRFIINTYK